jgi:hypothetical protein
MRMPFAIIGWVSLMLDWEGGYPPFANVCPLPHPFRRRSERPHGIKRIGYDHVTHSNHGR